MSAKGCTTHKDRTQRSLPKAQHLNLLKWNGIFQNNVCNSLVKDVKSQRTLALLK